MWSQCGILNKLAVIYSCQVKKLPFVDMYKSRLKRLTMAWPLVLKKCLIKHQIMDLEIHETPR